MLKMCVLALGFDASAAEIYRCTTPSGAVAFQETPCEAGASESPVRVREFPPVNTAERDRLLQREAALDARMVKRAEIDAAERMAKEARWAREAELESERQRAKAAEGSAYYPIYGTYPVYGNARPIRPRPLHPSAISPSPFRW
jgi:hypothetical protein